MYYQGEQQHRVKGQGILHCIYSVTQTAFFISIRNDYKTEGIDPKCIFFL